MPDPTSVPLKAQLQKDVVLIFGSGGTAKAFEMHASDVQLVPPQINQVTFQGGTPAAKASGSSAPGGWTLNLTAVQDFADPDSFANYCLTNAGLDVEVQYRPHRSSTVTFYTKVTVQSPAIGGKVDGSTFNTFSTVSPCLRTPSTVAPA